LFNPQRRKQGRIPKLRNNWEGETRRCCLLYTKAREAQKQNHSFRWATFHERWFF